MLQSKRRAMIFFTLSFVLAIISGMFVYQHVQALNEDLGGMTEIYVANQDLSSRELITSEMVTTTNIPNRFVLPSHITSFEELEDHVSVAPLGEGDLITANLLKPYAELSSKNNRMLNLVSDDHILIDNQLEALDRVDIIVSHDFEEEDVTEVFMTDIPVLMVSTTEDAGMALTLEVSFSDITNLVHMINYAESIQVLKANVGQPSHELEDMDEQESAASDENEFEKEASEGEAEDNEAEEDNDYTDENDD